VTITKAWKQEKKHSKNGGWSKEEGEGGQSSKELTSSPTPLPKSHFQVQRTPHADPPAWEVLTDKIKIYIGGGSSPASSHLY
jgi:hypothetical protein